MLVDGVGIGDGAVDIVVDGMVITLRGDGGGIISLLLFVDWLLLLLLLLLLLVLLLEGDAILPYCTCCLEGGEGGDWLILLLILLGIL